MQFVERTGRTVEEAVEAALEELGVSRDEVEVEILKDDGEAQVRVMLRAADEEEYEEDETDESDLRPDASRRATSFGVAQDKSDENSQRAQTLVEELLQHLGANATVEVTRKDADGLHLSIEGDELGFIIGKRGQTLHALQYLVNTILNHGEGREHGHPKDPGGVRVLLDAASYRERRLDAIQRMARRAADKARQRGRRVRLDPMPSYERRLVHMALADERDVKTFSVGEEPHRQVVIEPAEQRRPGPAGYQRPEQPVSRPVDRPWDRPRVPRTTHRPTPNRQKVDSRFFDDMFKEPKGEQREDEQ